MEFGGFGGAGSTFGPIGGAAGDSRSDSSPVFKIGATQRPSWEDCGTSSNIPGTAAFMLVGVVTLMLVAVFWKFVIKGD